MKFISPNNVRAIISLISLSAAGALTNLACSGSSTVDALSDAGGTDTNDASYDSGTLDVVSACAASAKARCLENDTCTNGALNKERYGDEATCEARLLLGCEKNLAATSTGATPSTVASCAASIPNETCAQYRGNEPADTCLPPAGTVANGGACGVSAQCQSTYCAVAPHSACGTCADVPALGGDCTATQECGAREGLVCSADNKCVQQGTAGTACGKDAPCGPDLTCVTAKGASSGSCVASVATVGATCDHTHNTGPGCDAAQGLFCDPTTNICVAYSFAGAGKPCGELADGLVACTNGSCVLASNGDGGKETTGTCAVNAADGQPCEVGTGAGCQSPAKCIVASDGGTAGTCTIVDPSTCQ